MLFSAKSILVTLVAFVAATGAVPATADKRCHATNRYCNPYTVEKCPACCFDEQCIGRTCTVDCDSWP